MGPSARGGMSLRTLSLLTSFLLLAALAVGVAAPASAEPAFPPAFLRSIGGVGHGALYPWGVAYNVHTDELVVTDYVNYQVRRFSTDGEWLGDFTSPANPDTGDPESVLAAVAVDPRNGDVYVGKPKPDTLVKYTKDGQILRDTLVPGARYIAWMTVDGSGNVYALDSHLWNTDADPSKLFKLDENGNVLQTWVLDFPYDQKATQSYGIDVAADGRIFLSDATNRTVHVLGSDGVWLYDIGSGQELSGDLRSVVLDESTRTMYVTDAMQDEIEVYSMSGPHLRTIGGAGVLNAPRQLALDADGRLWVAEYGRSRLQAFDAGGSSLGQYPAPAPGAPPALFVRPKDVDVDLATGEVWVPDTWNQRFSAFAADGSFLGTWGDRGNGPPYGQKYPRGIGFDPGLRRLWVPQHAAGTIMRYDDDLAYADTLGFEEERGGTPGRFDKPLDVEFHAGKAIVTDSATNLVKVLDADTGSEQLAIPQKANGTAVDPATGDIYAADPQTDKVFVYSSSGVLLRSFGSRGSGNGQFREAWDATIVDGVLYVTDRTLSNVQAFALDGTFLGKWGGYGTGPYQFANPSGISHDASGRIYVADTENDRVQVFDPGTPRTPYEWTKPTATISAPSAGAAVETTAHVEISGLAADNGSVATVEVAVRDQATGKWWDPQKATWSSTQKWARAAFWGPAPTVSVSWQWGFPGAVYGHSYRAEARAADSWGNVSTPTGVEFSVIAPLPADVTPADTSVASPAPGAVLPLAAVGVVGSASDDRGVAGVAVSVQDTSSGLWWDGAAWGASRTELTASLTSAGQISTDWTYSFTPPGLGSYAVEATARDAAGNTDPTPAVVPFGVVADAVAPDTTVTAPLSGQRLPEGLVGMAGSASDDVGVARVEVAVRDTATGLWWTGATWGGFKYHETTLASPGAASTGWTFALGLPPGSYGVLARATDVAGKVDPTRPWIPFGVVEGTADTTPPDASVAVPVPRGVYSVAPLTMSGSATDDVGVGAVDLAVRDTVSGLWWNGSSWGAFTYLPATLDAPGTASTGWEFSWTPPGPGAYGVSVRATDTSGNIDPTRPWVAFTTL